MTAYHKIVAINVDIQNDFALPSGALSVAGGENIIDNANAINQFVRENGGQVIFTQDWHRPDNAEHFAKWPFHCLQNSEGAALHQNLTVNDSDLIAHKGMGLKDDGYSGWEGEIINQADNAPQTVANFIAELEKQATAKAKRLAIVIDGLATDYCVKATVLDVLANTSRDNTDVFVVTDAIRAVNINPGDGDNALQEMISGKAIASTSVQAISQLTN